MSPLPCVPAGRFRQSGTRDLVEGAERSVCELWSGGDPGRRSDRREPASGGSWVKAGEAPGGAGSGVDARAARCAMVIIGSTPPSDRSGRSAGRPVRLPLPAEVGAVQPHPMHDHGQPPRNRDFAKTASWPHDREGSGLISCGVRSKSIQRVHGRRDRGHCDDPRSWLLGTAEAIAVRHYSTVVKPASPCFLRSRRRVGGFSARAQR
jgi:hypothetical protein